MTTQERELADKKREDAMERCVAAEKECAALEDKFREAESALFKGQDFFSFVCRLVLKVNMSL